MLRALPKTLTKRYQVQVLVDTAFGSIDFFKKVRKMKYQAIAGVRIDRRLSQGGTVSDISDRGQQVYLEGLSFPVILSWYWLDRDDGKREKRFVVSTQPLSWSYISRLGKRRWMIEGFFKTAKHRFCLDCFRQRTVLGVYRFILLSIIAYLLAHWAYLWSGAETLPDWGESAAIAFEVLLPQLLLLNLIIQINKAKQLGRKHGLDLSVRGWQYG